MTSRTGRALIMAREQGESRKGISRSPPRDDPVPVPQLETGDFRPSNLARPRVGGRANVTG